MDPEEVSGTTMRFNKIVYQLEKGLPPNTVVPKLKQKVESMKDKVTFAFDLLTFDLFVLLPHQTGQTVAPVTLRHGRSNSFRQNFLISKLPVASCPFFSVSHYKFVVC